MLDTFRAPSLEPPCMLGATGTQVWMTNFLPFETMYVSQEPESTFPVFKPMSLNYVCLREFPREVLND